MPTTLEFVHAPLAAGVTEDTLLAAALRFEAEVLAPRPEFASHAVLRSTGGERYAHLVAADDPGALDRLRERAPQLPPLQALAACLDAAASAIERHRPLSPLRAPARFAVLEVGCFAPRRDVDFTPAELERRAAALRDGYLRERPEHVAQTMTELGDGRYAELVFGDSLAHVQQTCHGYLADPLGQRLVELVEPASVQIGYWLPLLVRDLRAPRAPRSGR